MTRRTAWLVAAAIAVPSLAWSAPPAWVRAIADRSSAQAETRDSALVLIDQADVVVSADGQVRTSRRYAIRLRDREARESAAVREVYISGSGRVLKMRGWLLRASGEVREYGGRETVDVALALNDVYNEARMQALGAADEIGPGDLFAAETETEERMLFAQFDWPLQGRWPVGLVRRTLSLPEGWRATSVTFNHAAIEPARESAMLAWEARGLPAIADEPNMPPLSGLVPRIAVSLVGAPGRPVPGQFGSWNDVSAWLAAGADPQATATDQVASKARELCASATTDMARIKAIGQFVQHVQYISIQIGLGRGGGYRPRPAGLVLQRNYGDCKDKANLMKALLGAVGVRAHLVTVFAGDRDYVRAEWPSPQQFNHVIVAVTVDDADAGAAVSVLRHPSLGTLLIFDPTDPHTPVGEIPLHEQDGLGLIVADREGVLARMPRAPVRHDRIERSIESAVDAEGAVRMTVTETCRGAFAAEARWADKELTPRRRLELIERQTAGVIAGATVLRAEPGTESPDGAHVSIFEIAARGQTQKVTNQLALLRLPFDLGTETPAPPAGVRQHGSDLEPAYIVETVSLTTAAGLVVDELPAPVTAEGPFGRYSLAYAMDSNGRVVAKRELSVPARRISPAEHSEAAAFFSKVRAADRTPVILARRPGGAGAEAAVAR